jgi:hypothetical protein
MTYLGAKKIYPGNWTVPLNGWYKNIDTNAQGGTSFNNTKSGPTSVLAVPGYRYFQQRGYVPVSWASGSAATSGQFMQVIVPSPYRQDDTRTDITGMVISGSATQTSYVYRTAVSVASGWDGRAASGVYASTGNIISFGRNTGTATAVTGVAFSGVAEGSIQANMVSTVSGDAAGKIYFSGGTQGFGTNPFITSTGLPSITGVGSGTVSYYPVTASTTLGILAKGAANDATLSGGIYISDADVAAGRVGYLCVEVCYIRPDDAPGYEDIDAYLLGRTVTSG